MKGICLSFAVLWLLQLVAASGDLVELVPLPRHLWDQSIRKRDEATEAANVTLMDHEQMLWTSPPNDTHPKIVSMVLWTGQDRLILDMAKFGWELKTVNCTENMMVQFRHNISFQAAKKQWDWVNFNGMRSFVMIADHIKCGRDWSPNPWLVSTVRFDPSTLKVFMEAEKKTWKNITRSYAMDFGEVQTGRKRLLDFNLDKAFTLDLASTFPSKIIAKNWTSGNTKASFGVSCVDCGTSGQLVFAGHIEGSAFGGIDKFMVSATPVGLQAALNLEVAFEGIYKFTNNKEEFDLLTIPLPYGWTIPGVLTFGPNAKVIAGYSLDSIQGSATVTTGVAAKIPDDSLAKVDLFGKKKLDVHGWIPTFETKPLEIQAEITAGASLYTKLAVAVSIEVLDENGVNVDVNLQFPKLIIAATGGYNAEGFCSTGGDTFGVSLDVSLGCELELEGWAEVDGNRKVLFEVDLYENDHLYDFPTLCIGMGGDSDSSCAAVPQTDDADWFYNEIDSPNDNDSFDEDPYATPYPTGLSIRKRNVKDPYFMECDKCEGENCKRQYPIQMRPYPGPGNLAKNVASGKADVPVMEPGSYDCDDSDWHNCDVGKWGVSPSSVPAPQAPAKVGDLWDAEHVYEGDFIKSFLDHLYETHFKAQGEKEGCAALAGIFKLKEGGGWMDQLMNQLGRTYTVNKTMTLFTKKENQLKHRILAEDIVQIDSKAEDSPSKDVRLCRIRRVVNSCRYLMHEKTKDRMRWSIVGYTLKSGPFPGVNGIFTEMDKPGSKIWDGRTKPTEFTTWQEEHQTWFDQMYKKGFTNTRKKLQTYADGLTKMDDYKGYFDSATEEAIDAMAKGTNLDTWCMNDFNWP